jgi:hypothetical protein
VIPRIDSASLSPYVAGAGIAALSWIAFATYSDPSECPLLLKARQQAFNRGLLRMHPK